jgi:hypothetical protein
MPAPNQALFNDERVIRRLGNKTTTSASETLLSLRSYIELTSERQCAVDSTSAQDDSGGTGAKKVRIIFQNSAYERKVEDVVLNGTVNVNTVATDIRFIEDFFVIEGAAAAGAIRLLDGTTGGASEFCGIGSGTEKAFLCHHYVPAGKEAWAIGWNGDVEDEVAFKLKGQLREDGTNLVDHNLDLINLRDGGAIVPSRLSFDKPLNAVKLPEKSRVWVNVVPFQATSTVIRGELYVYEQDIPS